MSFFFGCVPAWRVDRHKRKASGSSMQADHRGMRQPGESRFVFFVDLWKRKDGWIVLTSMTGVSTVAHFVGCVAHVDNRSVCWLISEMINSADANLL